MRLISGSKRVKTVVNVMGSHVALELPLTATAVRLMVCPVSVEIKDRVVRKAGLVTMVSKDQMDQRAHPVQSVRLVCKGIRDLKVIKALEVHQDSPERGGPADLQELKVLTVVKEERDRKDSLVSKVTLDLRAQRVSLGHRVVKDNVVL